MTRKQPTRAGTPGTPGVTDVARWFTGQDTGISSETIMAVMCGTRSAWPGVPLDAGDFGRCHRLIERFPAFRARLGEVADAHPEWTGIVEHWDDLSKLVRKDDSEGVHALLKKLRQRDHAETDERAPGAPAAPSGTGDARLPT